MMVELKENISKKFMEAVESRKSQPTVDAVDGAMNVEETEEKPQEHFMDVPTDADRIKLCHDFQEKRIDDITKLLIKEKRPPGSKFASLKKMFKNENKERKSSTRQFVQQLSALLTIEYREKKEKPVKKKIQSIFARLKRTKSKSIDETDSVVGTTADGNSDTTIQVKNEKIILGEKKHYAAKLDEISDLIKDFLDEQQLADVSDEKLEEFLRELVAAYIPLR